MKKIVLLSIPLLLGFILLLFSGWIAGRLDRLLYPNETLFSQASEELRRGKLDLHENTLKDLILRENISESLRSLALFNLGVASLAKASRSDPAAARDARFYFQEALRNDPLLFPAKYNLELLLKRSGEAEKKKTKESASREGPQAEEENEMKRSPVVKPPTLGSNP